MKERFNDKKSFYFQSQNRLYGLLMKCTQSLDRIREVFNETNFLRDNPRFK